MSALSTPQIRTTVGETMRWAGTWSSAGALVNLTGYTLVAEVWLPKDPLFSQEAAVALGDQVAAPGTYTVDLSTLGLQAGTYRVRLRISEPDGDVYRSAPIFLLVEDP